MKIKIKAILLISFFIILFVVPFSRTLSLNVITGVRVLEPITDELTLAVQWAIPEKRVGGPGTNDSTTFYLTVRDTNTKNVLWKNSNLLQTNEEGEYLDNILVNGLMPGSYDVGFKSNAHLTKILRNAPLSKDVFVANFTNDFISSEKGPLRLIAGDINGNGLSVDTLGDDVINSIDLSIMISELDYEEGGSDFFRSNLNRDSEVNSVDLSLLLSNLDKEGEE